MKKGKVTSDILTYAGAAASERANKGGALGTASQASQAEQARYQNSVNDLAVVASNSGVEEGFARIFRTLNAGLSESNGLVQTLSQGFNEATKWADDLLLFPQSFIRALEGKDSLVADWLGIDDTAQLVNDWKEIKSLWEQITAIKPEDTFGNFLPTIEATAREIAGIFTTVAKLKQLNDNASASADIVQADIASRGTGPVSNFFASLAGSVAGLSAYVSTPLDVQESNQYKDYVENEYSRGAQFMKDREQLKGVQSNFRLQSFDPLANSQAGVASYNDSIAAEFGGFLSPKNPPDFPNQVPSEGIPAQTPADVASQNRDAAMAQAAQSVTNNNVTNQFDISINVDATLAGIEVQAQAEAMAQAFSTSLTGAFEQAQVNYPTKN
jgi:hypothetical protein